MSVEAMNEVRFLFLAPEDMVPWPGLNPRTHFDDTGLGELEASIREKGVIEPLAVHDRGEDAPEGEPRYWLVAGERRWRAADRIGAKLPCVVKHYSLAEALDVALIENIQRASLNPIEEARGFQARLDQGDITEAELAEKLGLSQPYINNRRRLLELPEGVQDLIARGLVKPSYARDMLLPWLREEPAIADRFFRVLVQHLSFQADVNEPFTKAFLASTVTAIANAVKPAAAAASPETAKESKESRAKPKVEPARETVPSPATTPAPDPEPVAEAADPEPEVMDQAGVIESEPEAPATQADPEPRSVLSDRPTVTEIERARVQPEYPEAPSQPAGGETTEASEEPDATTLASAGLVTSIEPLLDRYRFAIAVDRSRSDGPVTVMITPQAKKGGGQVTPRVVSRPVDEIDAAVIEAVRALAQELTEAAA